MEKGAGLVEMLCPVGQKCNMVERKAVNSFVIPFCFRKGLASFRSQESQKLMRRYLCLCMIHSNATSWYFNNSKRATCLVSKARFLV